LRVKYQWPELARVKLETSPVTHTQGNCRSTTPRNCAVRAETVSGSGCSFGAADMERPAAVVIRHTCSVKSLPPPTGRVTSDTRSPACGGGFRAEKVNSLGHSCRR